jgi:hypothetical protein
MTAMIWLMVFDSAALLSVCTVYRPGSLACPSVRC